MNAELYNFYVSDGSYKEKYRKDFTIDIAATFANEGLSDEERVCRRFEMLCANEEANIQEFEKIVMTRTTKNIPDCFTDEEWSAKCENHFVHGNGYVSNICPNWGKIIDNGLLFYLEKATPYQTRIINAMLSVCDKYLAKAEDLGRQDLIDVFSQIPRYGARNFREALQFFRILNFFLWLEGNYNVTLGRFDVYMYPYFIADMESGVYTEEEALELIEDFFISLNKDADLYYGANEADNYQGIVLGGVDKNGNDVFNMLSALCILAAEELKLSSPKINLRINKNTDEFIIQQCMKLTKAGLKYPQYSNDDVVIPALRRMGYRNEDAVNYVVAGCGEFIIPGCGNDVPGIAALNLARATDYAIRDTILKSNEFEDVLFAVRESIEQACDEIIAGTKNIFVAPSPLMDLMRDGKKYNNFGIHGFGIASAADALYTVKKYVYDDKSIEPEALLEALDTNFEEAPVLLELLKYETPKMGHGNRVVDALAGIIINDFVASLDGKKNSLGGKFRAGTGTAEQYVTEENAYGATANGRRANEAFEYDFSPSYFTIPSSPVSVVDSFTANKLSGVMNGGPLTLEFASSVFEDEENVEGAASLIKYFVERGGHQIRFTTFEG